MRRVRESRGVALIVVLTGITILAAFSAEFSFRSRVDVKVATNLEKQIQAYFHARSAMEIVRLVVTSQKFVDQAAAAFGVRAGSFELWRYACKFAEIFNTSSLSFLGFELMNLKGTDGLGVEKGGFKCEITPEESRINVNSIGTVAERKTLFTKLYPMLRGQVDPESSGTGDDRKAAELILNIMDWVDTDDERSDIDASGNFTQSGGAGENVAYSRYGYKARNAKMDSVDEIRQIEGMTDELFCRFGKDMTVYGSEKLNVNEASTQVIRALLCDNLIGDPFAACGMTNVQAATQAQLMPIDIALGYMEMCRSLKKALYTPPFGSEGDFLGFFQRLPEPLNQFIKVNESTLRPLVGTKSKVLRVVAQGWVGESGHQIEAVIDGGSTNWLYWKESGFDATSGE